MTGIGTLLLAAVAVSVALYSEWRSDQRLREEHKRSDRRLREERDISAEALQKERERAQHAEQLSEAYLVQVALAKSARRTDPGLFDKSEIDLRSLVAVVINRGRFAVTGVEARFRIGDAFATPLRASIRRGDLADIPEELRSELAELVDTVGALSPRDMGMRFESFPVADRLLVDPYAVIRWTDNWGARWENRNGAVRRIAGEEMWET